MLRTPKLDDEIQARLQAERSKVIRELDQQITMLDTAKKATKAKVASANTQQATTETTKYHELHQQYIHALALREIHMRYPEASTHLLSLKLVSAQEGEKELKQDALTIVQALQEAEKHAVDQFAQLATQLFKIKNHMDRSAAMLPSDVRYLEMTDQLGIDSSLHPHHAGGATTIQAAMIAIASRITQAAMLTMEMIRYKADKDQLDVLLAAIESMEASADEEQRRLIESATRAASEMMMTDDDSAMYVKLIGQFQVAVNDLSNFLTQIAQVIFGYNKLLSDFYTGLSKQPLVFIEGNDNANKEITHQIIEHTQADCPDDECKQFEQEMDEGKRADKINQYVRDRFINLLQDIRARRGQQYDVIERWRNLRVQIGNAQQQPTLEDVVCRLRSFVIQRQLLQRRAAEARARCREAENGLQELQGRIPGGIPLTTEVSSSCQTFLAQMQRSLHQDHAHTPSASGQHFFGDGAPRPQTTCRAEAAQQQAEQKQGPAVQRTVSGISTTLVGPLLIKGK